MMYRCRVEHVLYVDVNIIIIKNTFNGYTDACVWYMHYNRYYNNLDLWTQSLLNPLQLVVNEARFTVIVANYPNSPSIYKPYICAVE